MRLTVVLLLATLIAPSAFAHESDLAAPRAATWTLDPWLLAPLAAAAAAWAIGFLRLLERTRAGRRALLRRGALFALGLGALAAAVVSPLHAAGERSFTFHMIEHEVIMMAAAPLLVLGRPGPAFLWAAARPWRGTLGALAAFLAPAWRRLSAPLLATALQASALWLWHAPGLFDLALSSEGWHRAQHASFFLAALLFWAAMLDRRRDFGLRALCLFATSIVSGALGALMAVSRSPWYAPYSALGMTPWGLTPAEDQQVAGALMWVPGGFVHAAAALGLLAPLLRAQGPDPRQTIQASCGRAIISQKIVSTAANAGNPNANHQRKKA